MLFQSKRLAHAIAAPTATGANKTETTMKFPGIATALLDAVMGVAGAKP